MSIEIPQRGDPYVEVRRQIKEEMRYQRMMEKEKSDKFKGMTDETIFNFWYSTDGAFFMADRFPITAVDLLKFLDMIRIIRNCEAIIERHNKYIGKNQERLVGYDPIDKDEILSSFYTLLYIKAGELGVRTVGWKSSVPPALREVAKTTAGLPLDDDHLRSPIEHYPSRGEPLEDNPEVISALTKEPSKEKDTEKE